MNRKKTTFQEEKDERMAVASTRRERRFEFGKNWRSFLSTLDEERIRIAEASILEMVNEKDLRDKRVLDIGCGSGLFSLAARNLGAIVHSFDYDPVSVACTEELRSRYYSNDPHWVVERASVLDKSYLDSIGQYDLVYSWGVLHHTGSMWQALENAASMVAKQGTLFIAIYNDQGAVSTFWKTVKACYCSGYIGKVAVTGLFLPYFLARSSAQAIIEQRNVFREYREKRGMSLYHDWIDWLGGWPFEVASVEQIFDFFQQRGFRLRNIKTTNSLGNNQFVFVHAPDAVARTEEAVPSRPVVPVKRSA